MTPNAQASTGYGRLLGTTATPKRGEYNVFARITARLKAAQEKTAPIGARAAALYENRRLWIEVAAQVADEENELPYTLRQQLFSLSVYVQSYSSKALNQGTSLDPLIAINKSIMAGLQANKEVAA